MLRLDNIHTFYGKSHILHGVSIEVGESSVISLVGRNGVGKTTTLRSIIGFSPPQQGVINFQGINITGFQPHVIARMGIALVPQGRRIFPSLSVEENLAIAAYQTCKSSPRWNQDKVFSLYPILSERRNLRANTLSGGEMQMLAIARALMTNPKLILMDEPTEGLAPLIIREIRRIIQTVKEEKITSILLVEQNYQIVLDVADYVYVMSKGEIVYESRPQDLMNREELKVKYLGTGK